MATTTSLQLEILNILKGDMHETDKHEELLEDRKRPASQDAEMHLKNTPIKKLKSSDTNCNNEDEDLNLIPTEIDRKGDVDGVSTDSEDISDDEIEIIKDILPATISSELLSVVSNVSKEVVESMETSNEFSNDGLDLSCDTGFGSDDNLIENIPNAEKKEKEDNTSIEDVDDDCLLLSSPTKPQAEMKLNPLYSSTESEDSTSSSGSDSRTLDSQANIINNCNGSSNSDSSSVADLPSVQGKISFGDDSRDTDEDGGPDLEVGSESGGGGSGDVSEENDDITVLEISSLGIVNDNSPSNKTSDIKEDKTDPHEDKSPITVEKPSLTTSENEDKHKFKDIKAKFENCKTEHKSGSSMDNSIIIVNLDDEDEVDNVETDGDSNMLERIENNVKDEEKMLTSTKLEKKDNIVKEEEEKKTITTSMLATKDIFLKEEEEKIDKKETVDQTKIRKCYVHCERAKIPAGLPVPKCDDCVPEASEDAVDVIELLDPYPGHVVAPCSVCQLAPDRVSFFSPGSGVDEATAVRVERISVIPWELSLENDFPPCFKASNLSIYDAMGHLVPYDGGLIEAGQQLYFSGLLMNIIDDTETLAVDRIGPLTGWRRPDDGVHRSTTLVLTTCLDGTDVEYHVDCNEFSQVYKDALKKEQLYKNFAKVLNSVSTSNLTQPKPKSIMTDLKPTKVQRKSENLKIKTTLQVTPVTKKQTRGSKRKLSECEPSGTSDEDWSPDRSRGGRKAARKEEDSFSDSEEKRGGNPHFTNIKKKVPAILKSLDNKPGVGKGLSKLLPSQHLDSCDAVAAFLFFIYERQKIWVNKTNGVVPMTKNKVMSTKWFTNMYRELDRGTLYFRKCIVDTVLKGVAIDKSIIDQELVEKVLFRSIVYRLINKVETFTDFGGLPDLGEYPKFQKFLAKKKDAGVVIFTAAHQNMGYDRLMKTFEFVKKNVKKMASEIVVASRKRTIKKCQDILLQIPNVGAFFAWQILCDLLECRIIGSCTDNQWACLGPGAKNGLRRIFPLNTTKGELKYTRLLRDLCAPVGPGSGFQTLGLQFPAFLNKALSLKNIEHALCEYDKYFRSALGVQIKEREYSEQKSRSGLDAKTKCGDCDKVCSGSGKVMCALCSTPYHKKCRSDWETMFHIDGTWLCRECHKSEQAWAEEDFEYEEVDKNDDIERAFFSGAAKKEARLKRKGKKKTEKKAKQIECIDLSGDEEEDDGDDEDDDESDEEVEYLESVKGHFFGIDFNETANYTDTTDAEDEEDPFAGVGGWSENENSKEEDSDDILILS